jgi:hypothetical protein
MGLDTAPVSRLDYILNVLMEALVMFKTHEVRHQCIRNFFLGFLYYFFFLEKNNLRGSH